MAPSPSPAVAARPTAKILGVELAKGEDYKRVRVSFENQTSSPCSIKRYTVRWGKDAKSIDIPFAIPAGESRERSAKVHPADGNLEALTVDNVTVEMETSCP